MKKYISLIGILCVLCLTAQSREVYPLNDDWHFYFRTENSSDDARLINLPHTWNTPAEGKAFRETTANYLNNIFIPGTWSGKRLFIKFYGAQSVADIFINGYRAGSHYGGGTAFAFEITDKVRFGSDNSILAVVSNTFRDDVLPTSTDMNLYGGLYRGAELIVTEKTAVSPLYLGSEGVFVRQTSVGTDKVEGEVEVHLTSAGENSCMLTIDIASPDGRQVFSKRVKARIDGKAATVAFSIDKPRLWSPENPVLYEVTASIGERKEADAVSVRTGFRSIAASAKNGVAINGQRIALRGVALHHDNAVSSGALTRGDYDSDLLQIRAMGANALRSAVMSHAQYLYDRCDEQGMLVWIDMPMQRSPFFSDVSYFSSAQFEQNGMTQLREIIAQNFNHPSVIMWGLFSELWARGGDDVIPYLRKLNDAARAADPSRPTVACSDQDGDINFITKLIVWRQSVGWYRGSTDDVVMWRNQLQKNWSHLSSGVAYGGSGRIGHKSGSANTERMSEGYQTHFHEEYAKNLQNDSLFWGTWINNMYDYGSARRNYGINSSGLVSIDRRQYKDAYYLYKALWNTAEPTLHIVGKRHEEREGDSQIISVYSSAGAPQLFIDGNEVAVSEYAPCQYRSEAVVIRGRAEISATAGDMRDTAVIATGNPLKPRRQTAPRRTGGPQQIN